MTTIDHQQAAVRAIADALPGISGDGEDHLREATAMSALTAATPHLRAGMADEKPANTNLQGVQHVV